MEALDDAARRFSIGCTLSVKYLLLIHGVAFCHMALLVHGVMYDGVMFDGFCVCGFVIRWRFVSVAFCHIAFNHVAFCHIALFTVALCQMAFFNVASRQDNQNESLKRFYVFKNGIKIRWQL